MMAKAMNLLAAALLFGGGVAGIVVGCSAEPSAATPEDGGSSDAPAVDQQTADAGPEWDPVWHQTTPKQWPTIGKEDQPFCGIGCRMVLNVPIVFGTIYAFGYDPGAVVAWTGPAATPLANGIVYSKVGESDTSVLGPSDLGTDEGVFAPYVHNDYVSYVRSLGIGKGSVEVMSVTTGETKTVFEYTPATVGDNAVYQTALNKTHAFWWLDGTGLMTRNLETGAVKELAPQMVCHGLCTTENAVICSDFDSGQNFRIDQETGDVTPVDFGGALQLDGYCSPDAQRLIWVDYRDPPGPGSTAYFKRTGGEIYMRDLVGNTTTRLTFDSPDQPRGKTFPAIGSKYAVWNEPPEPDVNPPTGQDLYASSTNLVRLELATGKKCRLTPDPPGQVKTVPAFAGFKAMYGSKLVGIWFDNPATQKRLAELDLEDPGLPWKCEP